MHGFRSLSVPSVWAMSGFRAIVADPPWAYDSPRALVGNGGRGGAGASRIVQADVEQHYETMSADDIAALPVASACAKDAVLFLWTTNPFLADGTASRVVTSWGFTPKTVITWAKVQSTGFAPSMKTGHWFRSASEHVVFGVRGSPRRPAAFRAMATWFPERRLPHSVKPDLIYDIAETVCPEGPYLEMFARRLRLGWVSHGNEVPRSFELGSTNDGDHDAAA